MTGWQLMAVWLFGIFCVSVAVSSVARSRAGALVDVAKQHARAHVEGMRVVAEAQHGTLTVPPAWSEDGL